LGGREGLDCITQAWWKHLWPHAGGWGTDFPGLGWRRVVEHPSALTLPFRAGRLDADQMKDGQQPLGRGETLEEAT